MGPRKGVAILLLTAFCVGSLLTSQAKPLKASKRTICNIYGGCGEDPPETLKPDSAESYSDDQDDPVLCNQWGCNNGEYITAQPAAYGDADDGEDESTLAKHAMDHIEKLILKNPSNTGFLDIAYGGLSQWVSGAKGPTGKGKSTKSRKRHH